MKKVNTHSIVSSISVQSYLEEGLKKVSLLLEETYGPMGKNILFDIKNNANPELHKNGSKIIKNLRTKNQLDNLLFLILDDSFQKISNLSGDGTKTFFLITSYLILNGFKNIIQNIYSLETKIGISKTINYVLKILNDKTLPINTKYFWDKVIERYIPEDDNLKDLFKEAFEKIEKSGQIKIKTETGKKSNLIIEPGMQISRGYFSPYFMTDTKKMLITFNDPYVLVSTQKITMADDYLIKLIEPIIYEKKPILILSPEIDEQALSTLILNKINGILDIAYIKVPQTFLYDKTILEDLALYTNAKLINSNRNWKSLQKSDLGKVEKVVITKTKSIFWGKIDNQELLIKKKCQDLKQQILFSDSEYENEKRENRRKNFTGLNATIEIGGITDLETSDLRARTEMGVLAAKACLYEGVLPGGGLSFVQLVEEIENWSRSNLYGNSLNGSKLVLKALIKPMQLLLSQQLNSNNIIKKSLVNLKKIEEIKDPSITYDLKNHELVNIRDSGVLDSFKSIRIGLQTSISLTYSILSIANIII